MATVLLLAGSATADAAGEDVEGDGDGALHAEAESITRATPAAASASLNGFRAEGEMEDLICMIILR
jgi:hypothetical protein